MRILSVSPTLPRDDRLSEAVEALAAGGVIAVPTETFYGLTADSFNAEALARINRLKGKAADTPNLLLLADADQVEQVTAELPPLFRPLAEKFWPGPLTLVVAAAAGLPAELAAGLGTLAVRVPGVALPRRLAAALGRPIAGPSANRTGEPACRAAVEVARAFPEGLDLILDGGWTPGGAPSTILDLCSEPPRVVRKGLLPMSALQPFINP